MTGKLCLITLESAERIGVRVDQILSEWRGGEHFSAQAECPRFSSGEAKCVLRESVRDRDVYILVDVCNMSLTYTMYDEPNRMSPDDHYQDLKRVIAACNGKAGRIIVIIVAAEVTLVDTVLIPAAKIEAINKPRSPTGNPLTMKYGNT